MMSDHQGVQPRKRISVDKLPDGGVLVSADRGREPINSVLNTPEKENRSVLSIGDINDLATKGWVGKRKDYRRHECLGARDGWR